MPSKIKLAPCEAIGDIQNSIGADQTDWVPPNIEVVPTEVIGATQNQIGDRWTNWVPLKMKLAPTEAISTKPKLNWHQLDQMGTAWNQTGAN